jgi:8-amino-7-oxononanoate synthase
MSETEEMISNPTLLTAIFSHVAELTQYDINELDRQSHLENDLGVDSITLMEVMSHIYKKIGISMSGSVTLNNDAGIETINDIYFRIEELIGQQDIVFTVKEKEKQQKGSPARPAVLQYIRQVISSKTGYSLAELSPSVNLEKELGIDTTTKLSVIKEICNNFFLQHTKLEQECESIEHISNYIYDQLGEKLYDEQWILTRTIPALTNTYEPQNTSGITQTEAVFDSRTMMDFSSIEHHDLFYKAREFSTFYKKKEQMGHYWYGMPLESTCTNKAIIYDQVAGKSREFLMFGSNSYLGLSAHPQVISAIQDAAGRYGATNTGCRLIAGSNILHLELERKLAKLKGRESCIVYPSGYSANLGAISALAGRNDLVFTDNINHMSIQDGCKLSGASRKLYPHTLSSLEKSLAKYADHPGGKLIVTDGVFSMHGDIVDLPRLVKLANQYGARVLVDDAHSTGVLGATGSGTTEHFNMKGQVDLEMGTLSKSLSGLGGFICANEEVVEYLRFYSNSYVFAATIPAPVVAGVIASIDVMASEPQKLEKLWQNIRYIRSKLLNLGFNLENSASAIIPIVVGDDRLTLDFGRAVRARGLFCQTVVFPGVAVGDARLRMSITSEHTQENLDQACDILTDAALESGVKFANY